MHIVTFFYLTMIGDLYLGGEELCTSSPVFIDQFKEL